MNPPTHNIVGLAVILSGIMTVVILGLIIRFAFFKTVEGRDLEAQKFYRDFIWWCAKLVLIDLAALILLFTGGLHPSWFGAGIGGIIVYTLMGVHLRVRAWKQFKETNK